MNSMTGYGKGVASNGNITVSIELKSVNNRFLEINSRIPKTLMLCDDVVRKQIQDKLKRGTVEVFFSLENKTDNKKNYTVDLEVAKEYVAAAKQIRMEFLLPEDYTVMSILRLPDVLKQEAAPDNTEIVKDLAEKAIVCAVEELIKMREKEGESLKQELKRLVLIIAEAVEKASARAPKVVEEYRNKMQLRISDFLSGVTIDESRLLTEVAIFADRTDVTEELSRLVSHLKQTLDCLESEEPQGRKLDFLAQEMNREVNTLGSKSNDIELTNTVIFMKNELEKFKEQIRNVE